MRMRFFLMIILCPVWMFAQNIEKDHYDRILGLRSINTTSVLLDHSIPDNTVYGSVFIRNNGDTIMSLTMYFKTPAITSVNKGSKLIMELDDGSELLMHHAADDRSYGSKDLAFAFITLDAHAASQLRNHAVVKYRLETSGAYIDVFIREKAKYAIRDIVVLLEERMREE